MSYHPGETFWSMAVALPNFFPLRYGRPRSKARSLHENKILSRKLQHGHRWSYANWQIMTTKHKIPQPKGKTQIPQPDLRLTITRTAKQTAKGARAQQKQPQKICQGHSFFPSNAFMASARSFNTFNCMLQIGLQGLISAYT